MASNRRSDSGGRLRGLIPFRKRKPERAPIATSGLAVRPPWWRMAVKRMVAGLWPGFRAGQSAEYGQAESSGPQVSVARKPLLARREPLVSKTSVLRPRKTTARGDRPTAITGPRSGIAGRSEALTPPMTVTAPKDSVAPLSHTSAAHLLVGGRASVVVQQDEAEYATDDVNAAAEPEVVVRRESARTPVVLPPVAAPVSLSPPPALTVQRSTSTQAAKSGKTRHSGQSGRSRPRGQVQRSTATNQSVTGEALTSQALTSQPVGQTTSLYPSMSVVGPRGPQETLAASSLIESSTEDEPKSPEQRWREAVASVPLESPRPFPTSMRPLVAQLAGSAERVSYTTGPATRRALTEVGALGATTGTVVHLAQQPGTDMGVLAHELTHARSPISRPRFMLHAPTGSMDSDERHARSVGDAFTDTVSASPTMTSGLPPMKVRRLFGSNMMDGLTNQATGALGGLGGQATNAVSGLANQATSAIGSGASDVSGQLGSAASGLSDRFSSAANDFGSSLANQAGAVSAGLVDQLPVGGGSGIAQVARTAVENAVREATATTVAEAHNAVGQVSQAAQGMVGQAQGMASGLVDSAGGQVNQWVNGAVSQAQGAVQGVGDQASQAVAGAENAAAGAVNGAMNQAAGAMGLGPGSAPQISGQDLDRIAEALEERLLRQLERRGGRYAGVF
ncbi:eCIS core domain-containing protein [Actinocrispum wychmicini]|uniref:Uncharacterized protein DUF4157 n=1 Tax=Actinocrispum wychmicini TaxID=1213861 RepID=A0A4V2S6C3_9PSEU|nr:DUF4157 domain-containing protein [Actinocrispum wychmicini]TCO55200.1 uncharacterized protein DUF4157 [Actinocrispum wychmicini]